MNTCQGLVGVPWGIELATESKSSDFSNLKFDLSLGPAFSLAEKGFVYESLSPFEGN